MIHANEMFAYTQEVLFSQRQRVYSQSCGVLAEYTYKLVVNRRGARERPKVARRPWFFDLSEYIITQIPHPSQLVRAKRKLSERSVEEPGRHFRKAR